MANAMPNNLNAYRMMCRSREHQPMARTIAFEKDAARSAEPARPPDYVRMHRRDRGPRDSVAPRQTEAPVSSSSRLWRGYVIRHCGTIDPYHAAVWAQEQRTLRGTQFCRSCANSIFDWGAVVATLWSDVEGGVDVGVWRTA
jgi:hypothetical protein